MEIKRYEIALTKRALKNLDKLPDHIARLFDAWRELVETEGLPMAQKIPGYHDEPLKGKRKGQRSVRLSKAYRVIYTKVEGSVIVVLVEEIHKHDY